MSLLAVAPNARGHDLSQYDPEHLGTRLAAKHHEHTPQGDKVPMHAFWRLVNVIYVKGVITDSWSCTQMARYGMHRYCKQPSHEEYEAFKRADNEAHKRRREQRLGYARIEPRKAA